MASANYKEIALAVVKLIDSGKSQKQLANAVAEYMVSQRRTAEFERVMREVERLRRERGVLEVVATSASSLSDKVESEIRRLYDAKEVKVVRRIDKDLVGGVSLRTLDSQVDLSVRGRLRQLKNSRG